MNIRTVYVVCDFGGEWEDAWEQPIYGFTSRARAYNCALKRRARRARRPDDDPDDYHGSRVQALVLVDTEPI